MKIEENRKKQKIFIIPITWSTNIGNAFFALGIKYALEQALPDARVILLSDQAAYLNMIPGRQYRSEPYNSLKYLDHIRPDYVVLTGSLLTKQFGRIWQRTLEIYQDIGVKVALIGVGGYDYDSEEINSCRKVLQKHMPFIFISRDRETYQHYNDLSHRSYDGIDGAYFMPEVFKPIKTDLSSYIIINFDKTPEPYLNKAQLKPAIQHRGKNFNFNGEIWSASFPKIRYMISSRTGKISGFLFGLLGLNGTQQFEVGQYVIIRTDHQLNPIMMRRIFRGPNAYSGDIPYTYCNIYAQSELTLTDRIHAALVTMAYGKPAMLFSNSDRALIIERVGGERVTDRPTYLNMDILNHEKKALIEFLKSVPW